MLNILCIGDIVGRPGRNAFNQSIGDIVLKNKIDAVIVNAENAAGGAGLTSRIAKQFFRSGADVLTLGDHVWDQKELYPYLDEDVPLVRPANFPLGSPGKGWTIITTSLGIKIAVINLLGRVFMRYQVLCPFLMIDQIIQEISSQADVIIVDFHAETTSEKIAFGHYVNGRVSAVVGTHTHVQTADESILSDGTAYITDLGMTGPYDSVIGQDKKQILKRFLTSMPAKF
ncbi:MAG: TIGR00282 family metallophosphoesterase, partial [Candidatus Omnitrophica bacterium]|nr:TIGR00282 family metallophosphoesterase [Candidatus Omnitrophota bacterium]